MSTPVQYDRKIFAANLRRLMDEHRCRQVDIARLLNVSKSTVSAYCSGEQMPRMDKLELLSRHFSVSRSSLIESPDASPRPEESHAETLPILHIYNSLNPDGQDRLESYGRELGRDPRYRREQSPDNILYIKHYLVPAAAGYASPIQGEDYELLPVTEDVPPGTDFCISVSGDSMEPWIPDGSLVYVRRNAPMEEFDVGIFFVDGDVYCKQWCTDYNGTLHLLSANPKREDANISISRDSGRSQVCFGKVLLNRRLPRPSYV